MILQILSSALVMSESPLSCRIPTFINTKVAQVKVNCRSPQGLMSLCLHYKLRINTNNNEFSEADFLMSKAKKVISDKPTSQKCERGITSKKKDGILKLKECIPKNRLTFYQNLAVNEDVVNLLTEREKGE